MVLESYELLGEIAGNITSQVADNWVLGKKGKKVFDGVPDVIVSSVGMFGLVKGYGKWKGLSNKVGLNKLKKLVEMDNLEKQVTNLNKEIDYKNKSLKLNEIAEEMFDDRQELYNGIKKQTKPERIEIAKKYGKEVKREKYAIKDGKKITNNNKKIWNKQIETLQEVLSKTKTSKNKLQFSWGYQGAKTERIFAEIFSMSTGRYIYGNKEKVLKNINFYQKLELEEELKQEPKQETETFPLLNFNSFEAYIQQQEIEEQLRRNGKAGELNENCNFTDWIEEGQMLKVYEEDLDKIINKIKDIFDIK